MLYNSPRSRATTINGVHNYTINKSNEPINPLPCHTDCPKCGSEDIKRQHCRSNMTIVAYDHKEKFEDEYIKCYDYRVEIKKECIFNHCRICHYEWAVDVKGTE